MSEIITVGLDLAKNGVHAHGADGSGRAVLRKKLGRDQAGDQASHRRIALPCSQHCETSAAGNAWNPGRNGIR